MTSPIFFIYFCARDTSKVGKKLFSIGVNRVDHGFRHDPAAARCDVKSKKKPLSLLDQEPPLLDEDSNVWHKPGDLAEACLFVFPRGSIWYGVCQSQSSHRPRDTDPLQHVAV